MLTRAGHDVAASAVVFLIAVPLCVGVAAASGVPAELGLVTGIVGGLLTGLLPGSSLQVSGPAAGLTVLVADAVHTYGLAALGPLVLAAGVLQILLGALRCGGWFRAISYAVVEGMLAGIGLVIVLVQLYAAAGTTAPGSALDRIGALPTLAGHALTSPVARASLLLAVLVIAVMALWPKLPGRPGAVPAALAAVSLAVVVRLAFELPVATVEITSLSDAVHLPDLGAVTGLPVAGALGTVLAIALIASAESLFGAAAVDRLHDGPRTDFDKELMAQGAGNAAAGFLGALPLTAVVVRSAANVQAGARTKTSRVLHGLWLLLFAAFAPAVLTLVPVCALAGLLLHAGVRLLPLNRLRGLWRQHRGEAVILLVTAGAIVTAGMFEGVLAGLALSVAHCAWRLSAVRVDQQVAGHCVTVRITGNATFLRLPVLLDGLAAVPAHLPVSLDLSGLRHCDPACAAALHEWAARRAAPSL
ncbi:SulP family inorganic anion transporter [Streptomyces sp. IBSNAI002]|uniref:SulP family inorganic anion transporter n=1 Tax=Streptomyces sp. IBSNAI002 TaxID=3457500 RepID=UPI003FD6AED0